MDHQVRRMNSLVHCQNCTSGDGGETDCFLVVQVCLKFRSAFEE